MGLVALGGGRLDPDEAPLEPWVQMEDKVEEGSTAGDDTTAAVIVKSPPAGCAGSSP